MYSYLWLQQESIKNKITFNKVPGTDNPADMNTKGLKAELINKYVKELDMEHREGRAELSPDLNKIINKSNREDLIP